MVVMLRFVVPQSYLMIPYVPWIKRNPITVRQFIALICFKYNSKMSNYWFASRLKMFVVQQSCFIFCSGTIENSDRAWHSFVHLIRETMSPPGTNSARLPTSQLTTSHSQRLNSGKPLGTGCCEWLWSIATCANEMPHGTIDPRDQ